MGEKKLPQILMNVCDTVLKKNYNVWNVYLDIIWVENWEKGPKFKSGKLWKKNNNKKTG